MAAGTLSVLAALVWLVAAFDTGGAIAGPPALPPELDLALPIVALIAIAAGTWYLLRKAEGDDTLPDSYVECGACGRSILQEWRLCPYCGARIGRCEGSDRERSNAA